MDNSILPDILSYYPWACIVLGLYSVIVCALTFTGAAINFYQTIFNHGRYRYYYGGHFLVAGMVACRYYELYSDQDETLPLIMVDPAQATFTMAFFLILPFLFLTAAGLVLAKISPLETPLLADWIVKKKLETIWENLTQKHNSPSGKIQRKAGQHLALIIQDDKPTRQLIKKSLESERFMVIEAENGASGLAMAAFNYPDLVLLDSLLPDMEGAVVLQRLREWTQSPVIILTTNSGDNEEIDRVNTGHDYYLSKPIKPEELKEHVSAALRHLHHNHQTKDRSVYQTSIFKLDKGNRTLTVRKKEVHLTPHEFHLLSYLISHAGQVVTLKMIHHEFWGRHMDEDSLRQYIHKLRYKVEMDPVEPKYILTEPGHGYRLKHR